MYSFDSPSSNIDYGLVEGSKAVGFYNLQLHSTLIVCLYTQQQRNQTVNTIMWCLWFFFNLFIFFFFMASYKLDIHMS